MIPAIEIEIDVACPSHPMGYDGFWRCGRKWLAGQKAKAKYTVIRAVDAERADPKQLAAALEMPGVVLESLFQGLLEEKYLAVIPHADMAKTVQLDPKPKQEAPKPKSLLDAIAEQSKQQPSGNNKR